MKKPMIITLAILAALMALAAILGIAENGAAGRDVPLDLSLSNIEMVEIYYNPQLHGSVAVDRQTGVMYWMSADGAATLLVNEHGSPRHWPYQF